MKAQEKIKGEQGPGRNEKKGEGVNMQVGKTASPF